MTLLEHPADLCLTSTMVQIFVRPETWGHLLVSGLQFCVVRRLEPGGSSLPETTHVRQRTQRCEFFWVESIFSKPPYLVRNWADSGCHASKKKTNRKEIRGLTTEKSRGPLQGQLPVEESCNRLCPDLSLEGSPWPTNILQLLDSNLKRQYYLYSRRYLYHFYIVTLWPFFIYRAVLIFGPTMSRCHWINSSSFFYTTWMSWYNCWWLGSVPLWFYSIHRV